MSQSCQEPPQGPNGAPGGGREAPPQAPPPPSPQALLRLALVFYTVLFGVALSWAAFSGRSLLYASGQDRLQGIDWPVDAAAGALAGLIVILLSRELTERTRWGRELAAALGALLGPIGLRSCIVLALLSGVAEEAFFRGALQPQVGLVWASVIFGAAHFVPRRDLWPWSGFSVAAGFLLGALFELTGNLVAPVVTHALINAVNLRRIALAHGGPR